MLKLNKNKYKLIVDPYQNLFRWKVDAYPSLIYAVCCDMTRSPYGWPQSEGFFFGHDFYWYNNWSDIWEHGDRYIDKYLKKSRGALPVPMVKKYDRAFRVLKQKIAAVDRIDLSALSLAELRREWFRFFKAYAHFWLVITDVEVLSYAASRRLEQLVIREKIALSPEEISQLSAFPERSYVLEEEYELLRIAFQPKVRRAALLARHARQFSWIQNGYHGVRPTGEKFFYDRLREMLKDKKFDAHFSHLHNYHRETSRRFSALVRKHKLSGEIVKYARLAQQSSFLQDRRKALSWQATDYLVAMYGALAKFLNIRVEQALYILWDEFDAAVSNPKKMLSAIKERQHSCRLRMLPGRAAILTEDAKKIFAVFEREYRRVGGKEIRGTVAYPGRVRGRVQLIVNGSQLQAFQAGRILVTLMTSPDYILAMKKSRAIVTDDGGLTCHAAIVARELKKPCIVGTRNATRLLKDGDWVEVDAGCGLVKIINKK